MNTTKQISTANTTSKTLSTKQLAVLLATITK